MVSLGNTNKIGTGRITSGINLNTLQTKIIDFIYKQLPAWRDDPDRPKDDQSEPKLNSKLATFLDVQASINFPMIRFNHEELQFGNRSVDVSSLPSKKMVINAKNYTIYDPVLLIECKRLPAPSKDREKEYVTGSTPQKIPGGIQRFKLGLHGVKDNLAVMIGYVQDKTAQIHHKAVNKWICELAVNPIGDGNTWSKKEILTQLEENATAGTTKYHSSHGRKKRKPKIELYHLWIVMNMPEPEPIKSRPEILDFGD